MHPDEILTAVLDWHRREVTIAQDGGQVRTADHTLQSVLRILAGDRTGKLPFHV